MILVVGATGIVGSQVVKKLASAGKSVRALVREGGDPKKTDGLNASVEKVHGDLKDRSSLAAACRGVNTVVSTASATISRGAGDSIATVDRDGQLNLVDAAREAGVRHFIYLSFSGGFDIPSPLHDAKRTVERHLQDSGMAHTIVRPSIFMEVWLSPHTGFDPVGGAVRIFGTGDAPLSAISASDVAAYVAACVDNPAAVDQVIELGGPEAISFNTVVSRFEKALGRTVQKQHVPEAALQQQIATAGDPLQKTLAALAMGVAQGDAIDNTHALKIARVPLTSVDAYVSRVVQGHGGGG